MISLTLFDAPEHWIQSIRIVRAGQRIAWRHRDWNGVALATWCFVPAVAGLAVAYVRAVVRAIRGAS